MSKHEQKNCARCGNEFECRAGSINQCQCSTIQLTVVERIYIGSKYDDCLCADCLKGLQHEYVIFQEKQIYR